MAVGAFDDAFTLRLTPYSGSSLTTEAYYAAAWFVLLESVCGLFFTALFTEDCRRSVLLRLYSLGMTRFRFMAGKYLYPFLYRLVTGILLLTGLSFVIPLSLSVSSMLCALAAFALMSLLFGSAALWLSGFSGWQGILLALAVAGLFFCGGLVPRNMLPAAIINVGRFLPSGAFMSLLSPLFGGKADTLSVLFCLPVTALLTLLAARRLRLLPVKGGEE